MARSGDLRRALLIGLLVCSIVGGSAFGQSPAGDGLLKMVPAKCLFCIRINNLDQTLTQIDQYLMGVSPMGVSMLVRSQLANVLGGPQLDGVDMTGSFAVFGPLSGADASGAPKIGVLAPIADFAKFKQGNPNVGDPNEKGIMKIVSQQAGTLLAVRVGKYILVGWGDSQNELIAASQAISGGQSESLAGSLESEEAKQSASEQIWIYGNIPAVEKAFGTLLRAKIEEAKKVMEKMKTSGAPMMGDPAMGMDMYATLLDTFLKETKSLSASISAKPVAMNARIAISALPGTDMAAMFTTDKSAPEKNKLLGYLRDGAMMNFAFKMNTPFWKKLNEESIDFVTAMGSTSVSVENAAKMKAMAADMVACMGNSAVFSMSIDSKNKPPFAVREILEVKDKDKYNRLVDEEMALVDSLTSAEFYKSMGVKPALTLKRGVDKYKGVAIDAFRFTMTPIDGNSNSPQAQMIKAIYGQGIDVRSALVDGLCVVAVASDPNAVVRELIDQVKTGGPASIAGEVKAAMDALGQTEQADCLVTFNFLRVFQMASSMAMPTPMPMPQIDIPSKSSVALAGAVGGGKMKIDVAMPKEHLMEMSQFFQKMQQQQAQIRQQETKP